MSRISIVIGAILAAGWLAACQPAQAFVCQPTQFGREYPLGSPAYGLASVWFTNPEKSLWAGIDTAPDESVARFRYRSATTFKTIWWRGDGAEFSDSVVVTARRLDAVAEEAAGFGREELGDQQKVTLELPSAGCWEVVGTTGDLAVNFVMELTP